MGLMQTSSIVELARKGKGGGVDISDFGSVKEKRGQF